MLPATRTISQTRKSKTKMARHRPVAIQFGILDTLIVQYNSIELQYDNIELQYDCHGFCDLWLCGSIRRERILWGLAASSSQPQQALALLQL